MQKVTIDTTAGSAETYHSFFDLQPVRTIRSFYSTWMPLVSDPRCLRWLNGLPIAVSPWSYPICTKGWACQNAGVDFSMEVYPGMQHGFAMLDSVVYNQAASDHHFDQIISFFTKTLKN